MLTQIQLLFSKYLAWILGGLLAASLLGNVVVGFVARHFYSAYHDCKTATAKVNAVATERKQQVEHQDTTTVKRTEDRVRTRIADAHVRLRNKSRKPHMPPVASAPTKPTGEGGTTVVLPDVEFGIISLKDAEICVDNTIKAQEWQNFYNELLETRNVPDNQ